MLRTRKKVLALVLALAMALSLAVSAGAAFNDQDKIVNTEAVDMCVALNIINGYTDGSFKPEGNVTRAEAAKMITIALNGGKEPTLSASATPTYTDIAGHWAAKYIEYCTSLGVVAGDGAGKFNPNGNVKAVELAKMLLIALGYNAEHEKFVGGNWDTNVNVVASQKDLYEGLESIDPAVAATRDTAAQMVWNALQAKMVKYDYTLVGSNGNLNSQITVDDTNKTLLDTKYGTYSDEGILVGWDYDSEKAEWDYTIACSHVVDGKTVSGTCTYTTADDVTALFQQNVKVIAKEVKGETVVYGIFAEDSSVMAEGVLGDLDLANLSDKEIEVADVEYKTTGTSLTYYAFGAASASTPDFANNAAPAGYSMQLIDNTGDDKADVVVYVPFSVEKVTYVGTTTVTVTGSMGNKKLEDLNVTGTLAKDAYVQIVAAGNTAKEVAEYTVLDAVSGKVTATKGTTAAIDGTYYEVVSGVSAALGTEYDAYIVNGYIYVTTAISSDVDAGDYAVITKIAAKADLDDYAQAILMFTDGTTKQVNVKSIVKTAATENAAAVNFAAGDLVTFEVDEDVYELAAATEVTDETNVAYCGFEIADVTTPGSLSEKKIGTYSINDNAIVMVWDENGADPDKFSVITGAELKKADTATAVAIYGSVNDATNYSALELVYVKSDLTASDDYVYAYVTGDIANVTDADNNGVYEITVNNDQVLTTKYGSAANSEASSIVKGNIISYKLSDGKVTDLKVVGTDTFDGPSAASAVVYAYDGENIDLATGKVASKVGCISLTAHNNVAIGKDTVIIYVNTDEVSVAEGGSIQLANTYIGGSGTEYYYPNAAFVIGTDKNDDGVTLVDLLVVEVRNNMSNVTIK